MSEKERNTIVVNAFAGAGAGKTTSVWEIASELKKRGMIVEYVPEYSKELVWDENWDILDGSIAHQREILAEQSKRLNRLVGKVDVIVTDAPLLNNIAYCKDCTEEYKKEVFDVFSSYQNFNFFINRDMSKPYEQEGRMQNLQEARQMDKNIRGMLRENNIYYGTYEHGTILKTVDNIIKNYKNDKALNKTGNKVIKVEEKQETEKEPFTWTEILEKTNWVVRFSDKPRAVVRGDELKNYSPNGNIDNLIDDNSQTIVGVDLQSIDSQPKEIQQFLNDFFVKQHDNSLDQIDALKEYHANGIKDYLTEKYQKYATIVSSNDLTDAKEHFMTIKGKVLYRVEALDFETNARLKNVKREQHFETEKDAMDFLGKNGYTFVELEDKTEKDSFTKGMLSHLTDARGYQMKQGVFLNTHELLAYEFLSDFLQQMDNEKDAGWKELTLTNASVPEDYVTIDATRILRNQAIQVEVRNAKNNIMRSGIDYFVDESSEQRFEETMLNRKALKYLTQSLKGIHPIYKAFTEENVRTHRSVLKELGYSFDTVYEKDVKSEIKALSSAVVTTGETYGHYDVKKGSQRNQLEATVYEKIISGDTKKMQTWLREELSNENHWLSDRTDIAQIIDTLNKYTPVKERQPVEYPVQKTQKAPKKSYMKEACTKASKERGKKTTVKKEKGMER